MYSKNLLFLFLFFSLNGYAQKISLVGTVVDEEKKPVLYATVSLLQTGDSTLVHYGITNEKGYFEITGIDPGHYLLQSAGFGYKTSMQKVNLTKDSACVIRAELQDVKLKEVDIETEAVPLLIKKDTIEYNAGAFKTRPDANTEDLLKKLPGVEVDRSGNVRAQGETVSKVLVDGKEFFGDDPKVATKNLPADAVKKVQVYNKKSDESELTGIDDGTHQKIINLVLKDGKKSAILGDVMAGAGTGEHYQSSAKVYRFKQKSQFAALGMLNNINQFGFTFSDYLSFSGGLNSLASGDGLGNVIGLSNAPVNYGQPVTGLVTSGAGGLNYTYEKSKGNRFNVSYLGNGSAKKLDETVYTKNFVSGNSFEKFDTTRQNNRRQGHNFQLNWRQKKDSTQNLVVRATGSYSLSKQNTQTSSHTGNMNDWTNQALYFNRENDDQLQGNVSAAYLRKIYSKWRLFKISGEADVQNSHSNSAYNNTIFYPMAGLSFVQSPFQHNSNTVATGSVKTGIVRELKNNFYLEPSVLAGFNQDVLGRQQGFSEISEQPVDSLSPAFVKQYLYTRPGLLLKKNTSKTQFYFAAKAEAGQLTNKLNGHNLNSKNYVYLVPELNWEKEYKKQRRLGAYYNAYVKTPSSYELLPVANGLNPLQVYSGNASLRPEYVHNVNARWWIFDQFSMTTFFAGLNGRYTHDKISYARTVLPNLSQKLGMVNVPDDYATDFTIDFSTPIRKLKMNLVLNLKESWNRGISIVNEVQNINTNLTHSATVSVNNRKKEKWDVSAGINLSYTDARYSLQSSMNNTYYQYDYFSEVSYTPSAAFSFFASADVTSYRGSNFKGSVSVPLLKAEIKHYFLKDRRGVISIEAFDLLNKNKGVQRTSELNYLMERHSTIIRQYFMLSFKYKLNKFDPNQGLKIDVKNR